MIPQDVFFGVMMITNILICLGVVFGLRMWMGKGK